MSSMQLILKQMNGRHAGIFLDLKALVFKSKSLSDCSPFFAIHERLAMGLCLCEQ